MVYAMIETGAPNRGVLWRSDDGGENWRLVSYDRLLNERSHYAGRILVNPADEDETLLQRQQPQHLVRRRATPPNGPGGVETPTTCGPIR